MALKRGGKEASSTDVNGNKAERTAVVGGRLAPLRVVAVVGSCRKAGIRVGAKFKIFAPRNGAKRINDLYQRL